MDSEYKIFDKGFNKVLDLVESAAGQGAEGFQNLVDILPDEVLEETKKCEEFSDANQFYVVDLCNTGNTLHFDFARNYNYLRVMVKLHRIFQKELDENDNIELFEFVIKNTPTGVKNCSNALEYRWNINLVLKGYDYYLTTITTINNKVYFNEVQVSYDEIQNCLETENEYSPDLEVEFDADFDL